MSTLRTAACHRAETRMLQTTRNSPPSELSVWAPLVLAILRIVSALLLIDQGLITLLHFPQAGVPDALDAGAGVIESGGRRPDRRRTLPPRRRLGRSGRDGDGLRRVRSSRYDDPVLCHLLLPGVRGARHVEPGRQDPRAGCPAGGAAQCCCCSSLASCCCE